eukprot:3497912-Karenia_brevis.AAC.1
MGHGKPLGGAGMNLIPRLRELNMYAAPVLKEKSGIVLIFRGHGHGDAWMKALHGKCNFCTYFHEQHVVNELQSDGLIPGSCQEAQ